MMELTMTLKYSCYFGVNNPTYWQQDCDYDQGVDFGAMAEGQMKFSETFIFKQTNKHILNGWRTDFMWKYILKHIDSDWD